MSPHVPQLGAASAIPEASNLHVSFLSHRRSWERLWEGRPTALVETAWIGETGSTVQIAEE